MDKISVCIPTYQSAHTLRRAIDSALNQRGCDVQVVIGDNASTDNTAEVAVAHEPERIDYFRHRLNVGYPANVNSCLDRATSDYVFILCADDFLIHDGVLLELLQELKDGPYVAAHLPFQLYQERDIDCVPSGRPFSPLPVGPSTPQQVISAFTDGNGCFGWGWLFRRSLVSQDGLRFETDHDMAPDTMFWLSLSMKGSIVEARSRQPGYAFVMHADSLGGRIFNERALKVYEQLVTFESRLFERLRRELPAVAAAVAGKQFRYTVCEFAGLTQKAFSQGNLSRKDALGLLMHALRAHPRAAMTRRFVSNFVFVLLPRALRERILAARHAAASPTSASSTA